MKRTHSSARPLAAIYVLLVMYASLYPFSGWRWPAGASVAEFAQLPWIALRLRFDETMNFLGYVPLGALVYAAQRRASAPPWVSALVGVVLPGLLAYALEVTQHFLPGRVPSLRDAVLNACGAAAGAAAAMLMWRSGWFDRWASWRERWFGPAGTGALVLLLLWPAALLFPAPVPLGLGQVFDDVRAVAEAVASLLMQGETPGAASPAAVPAAHAPLAPWQEGMAVGLGLLAPCLVAYAAVQLPVRRLGAWAALIVAGVSVTTLSTALNFGPMHALAWGSALTWGSLGASSLLCLGLAWVPPRLAAGLALVALSALVTLVAQAPPSPYFAASLQLWEQGQFIRFHGMAQWVGWLWPYAAIAWLLTRTSSRA